MNISVPSFPPLQLKLSPLKRGGEKCLVTCCTGGVTPGQGGVSPARLRCSYHCFLVGKDNKFPSHLSVLWESRAAGKGDRGRENSQKKKIQGVIEATPGISPLPGSCCQTYGGRKGEMFPPEGRNIPRIQSRGVPASPGHPSARRRLGKLLPPRGQKRFKNKK